MIGQVAHVGVNIRLPPPGQLGSGADGLGELSGRGEFPHEPRRYTKHLGSVRNGKQNGSWRG